MNAALTIFAQYGYASSSIAQVASEAGISKGLVYNYFSSKECLLKELITEMFSKIVDSLPMPEGDFSDADFRNLIDAHLKMAVEDTEMFKLYFSVFSQAHVMDLAIQEAFPKFEPLMTKMTRYYQSKGFKNPLAMMRFMSATIEGIQMHIMIDPEHFPVEEVRKILYQLVNIKGV